MNAPGEKHIQALLDQAISQFNDLGRDFPRETAVLQRLKERLVSIRGAIEAALKNENNIQKFLPMR